MYWEKRPWSKRDVDSRVSTLLNRTESKKHDALPTPDEPLPLPTPSTPPGVCSSCLLDALMNADGEAVDGFGRVGPTRVGHAHARAWVPRRLPWSYMLYHCNMLNVQEDCAVIMY